MAHKELASLPSAEWLTGLEKAYTEQVGNSRQMTLEMVSDVDLAIHRQRILPVADTAAIDAVGVRVQAIGTSAAVVAACSNANLLASLRRTNYGNDASANFSGGFYVDGPSLWRGDVEDRGGFYAEIGMGLAAHNADHETAFFTGLMGETNPDDLVPSALLNMVGIGADLADDNLMLMHNNGAGGATKIDTGWPAKVNGEAWILRLSAAQFAGTIDYHITRLADGTTLDGSLDAELPVNTVFLGPVHYNNNGAGGGAGVQTSFLGYSARARSF